MGLIAAWAWISLTLIARLWVLHPECSSAKRISWSLILLVPLFGWIFYAGFFKAPPVTDSPLTSGPGADGGSI